MLMYPNSGLSREEVGRARAHFNSDINIARTNDFTIAMVALTVGVGLLGLAVFGWGALITIGLIGAVMAVLMDRRLRQAIALLDTTDVKVVVVRTGLQRVIRARDLVVGDLVCMRPGVVLPADVAVLDTTTTNSTLVVGFGIHREGQLAFAGMTLNTDATVQVVAVGPQRRLARVLTTEVDAQSLIGIYRNLRNLVHMVGAMRLVQVPVGHVDGQQMDVVDVGHGRRNALVIFARKTLTGRLRSMRLESEFRYNQGPVSWI